MQPRLVRHRSLVGGHAPPLLGLPVFRVDLPFHACRRHYPGGTGGCCRYLVHRQRPSPKTRRVGFRDSLFEACSAFTHVPACMVARSPKVTRYQSTSTHSLPPAPLWLLPAERPIGRVGFAPTGDRRLSRHTGFSGCLTPHGFPKHSLPRTSMEPSATGRAREPILP
jgi:hypothetical protein